MLIYHFLHIETFRIYSETSSDMISKVVSVGGIYDRYGYHEYHGYQVGTKWVPGVGKWVPSGYRVFTNFNFYNKCGYRVGTRYGHQGESGYRVGTEWVPSGYQVWVLWVPSGHKDWHEWLPGLAGVGYFWYLFYYFVYICI